jgi:hypothetical protein
MPGGAAAFGAGDVGIALVLTVEEGGPSSTLVLGVLE